MGKPPLVLFYPSYVIEYADVDDSIVYVENKSINVGGEWLGKVPRLAICFHLETQKFHLAHCDMEWELITAIIERDSVSEVKAYAEKYYNGISKCWLKTDYSKTDAIKECDEAALEFDEHNCSFCKKSPFIEDIGVIIASDEANICLSCIKDFYHREVTNGSN